MIYAVSVLIILFFGVLYFVFKPRLREEYRVRISDFGTYSSECRAFVRSLPLPKHKAVKLNEIYFSQVIKKGVCKLKSVKDCEDFASLIEYLPSINAFSKCKFDDLNKLASIDGVPRIVKLADFCLSHSNFEFLDERIVSTLNLQNEFRTLCFDEITSLNSAFLFVLYKKLAFLMNNILILLKMKRIADKNARSTNLIKDEKTYKELKDSKLFLAFCAENGGFDSEVCKDAKRSYLKNVCQTLEKLFKCKAEIEKTDFSCFYLPLQVFSKYEAFENANAEEKRLFLRLVKELSDKENVDELLFAIRIDNYMKSASAGHKKVVGISFFDRQFSIISAKRDVSMLASALSSDTMMRLLFGSNRPKTITKNAKFENTFAKINKFEAINLGICIADDKLTVKPHLPNCVESVSATIRHNDVSHTLDILRGKEKQLFLGNTKLSGTSIVKLGKTPIELTVVIPSDK